MSPSCERFSGYTAEEFLAEIRHLLPAGPVPIVEATPAIGVHVGPGALGLVCVAAAR